MLTLLITGGDGFIARNIYKYLHTRYHITLVTRRAFDLLDTQSVNNFFKDKYFDVLIHTAIVGGRRTKTDTPLMVFLNISMLYNLLENKSQYNYFINIGSGVLYDRYFDIADSFPQLIYSMSKNIISRILKEYLFAYTLRLYGCFGLDELNDRFIKGNLLRSIQNIPMVIYQEKLMDFFYIEDLARVIDYYITLSFLRVPKEIDLVYKDILSLEDIAIIIQKLTNNKDIIVLKYKLNTSDYISVFMRNLSEQFLKNIPLIGLLTGILTVYKKLKGIILWYNLQDIQNLTNYLISRKP